jgi:hypothetical protein
MGMHILFLIAAIMMSPVCHTKGNYNSFKVKIYLIDQTYKFEKNYFVKSFNDSVKLMEFSVSNFNRVNSDLIGETVLCPELKFGPELSWNGDGLAFTSQWESFLPKKMLKNKVDVISRKEDKYTLELKASLDSSYLVCANIINQNKRFMLILTPSYFDVQSYIIRQGSLTEINSIINANHNIEWKRYVLEKHKNIIDTTRNRFQHEEIDSLIGFCDGNSINRNGTTIYNPQLFIKEGDNYIYLKSSRVQFNTTNGSDTIIVFAGTVFRYKYGNESLLPNLTISGDTIKIVKRMIPFTILK